MGSLGMGDGALTENSTGKLTGQVVAVTGASGTLGRSLLRALMEQGARGIALTSGHGPVHIDTHQGTKEVETVTWQVGEEQALSELLTGVDILVLNHGVNVHGDRTPEAIQKSYEVNAFSSWRLLEIFLETVVEGKNPAKEVWVNTSEAESNPALSPLYELSKRTLGDLITLRRLDAPCPIRKIILGPFKSKLNPVGIMNAERVAHSIVSQAIQGRKNIVVTINPLTFMTFPLKEFLVSGYFRLFSQGPSIDH